MHITMSSITSSTTPTCVICWMDSRNKEPVKPISSFNLRVLRHLEFPSDDEVHYSCALKLVILRLREHRSAGYPTQSSTTLAEVSNIDVVRQIDLSQHLNNTGRQKGDDITSEALYAATIDKHGASTDLKTKGPILEKADASIEPTT